jgi:hypothetical protein
MGLAGWTRYQKYFTQEAVFYRMEMAFRRCLIEEK